MKTGTKSFLAVLAMAAVFTTGCKSTSWKMPGASLFARNREPDAATLAGTTAAGPEVSPGLPVSPASKYTPSNIASSGMPNSATSPGASSSPYGYTAQTVATPVAGLAAQANGYQTGPYQVGSTSETSTSTPYSGLPNPYGGSYTGNSSATQTPNLAIPGKFPNGSSATGTAGSSAAAPSTYPGAMSGYPNVQLPSATGNVPGSTASYPGVTPGIVPPTAVTSGLPAYPSLPPSSSVTSSAYQGNTTFGSSPIAFGSAGGASAAGGNALNASPTTSATGGYAPGTTGRNTTYNFGPSAPSIASPPNTSGSVLR